MEQAPQPSEQPVDKKEEGVVESEQKYPEPEEAPIDPEQVSGYSYGKRLISEFTPILHQLWGSIEAHNITCVLSDDKSSRLPGLLLGRTINNIYSIKGEEKIPVLFLDPDNYNRHRKHREDKDKLAILKDKIKNFFTKAGVKPGKVVFVTDFINRGTTKDSFEEIAKENGFELELVKRDEWYHNDMTHKHGLEDNPDELTIHSKAASLNTDERKAFNKIRKENIVVARALAEWFMDPSVRAAAAKKGITPQQERTRRQVEEAHDRMMSKQDPYWKLRGRL